ncbi:glycosyltransferase family 2 protein [Thermoplasma sp.]|uniref:glycosyltransferase family 2 protein n=1 Tax=Thermoplasma sp. TaxID=1973142 RepID=UPI002607A327|nr:glycosyltransferase family 2 protein [Thermoplasma sp.]
MKFNYQLFSFLIFFISPIAAAYFTSSSLYVIPLVYMFWLLLLVSITSVVIFQLQMFGADRYTMKLLHECRDERVVSFILSYNEDVKMLKKTIIAVKKANIYGETWLLDDSTDEKIVSDLREICDKMGVKFVHRSNRRGFKAGAINDAMSQIDDSYGYIAVFDSDQRPTPRFFNGIMSYFERRNVAVVQIPQTYTAISTSISESAFFQQEVFLRKIMRARNGRSAFILGSGFVARISAIRSVGGFYEKNVTEDLATSIMLQSLGWEIIYLDSTDIWYGKPPETVSAYLTQQGRWSLGGFQALGLLLGLKLRPSVFAEYMAGWLYWIWVGPIRLASIIMLILFLDFRLITVIIYPIFFIFFYFPYFIYSMLFYYYTVSDGLMNYGARGFFLHQGAELLLMFTATSSFISALLKRRKPFKVTPKGKAGTYSFTQALPMISLELLTTTTISMGFIWLRESTSRIMEIAIGVNIFFAMYLIPFMIVASVILFTSTYKGESDEIRLINLN